MKYYLYISDAKVDMLYPQVPHDVKKKVGTEFGFDWKIMTGKRRVETETEQDRISRLETVASFIREYADIGPADAGRDYIADVLEMKISTTPQSFMYGPIQAEESDESLVYLGGFMDWARENMLVLFGSSFHLIGNSGATALHPGSHLNYVLTHLHLNRKPTETVFAALHTITTHMTGIPQRLEFVAKTLGKGEYLDHRTSRQCQAILGTPLYIALADSESGRDLTAPIA